MATKTKKAKVATKTSKSGRSSTKRRSGTASHARRVRSYASRASRSALLRWLYGVYSTGIALLILSTGFAFARVTLFSPVDAAAGSALSVSGANIVDTSGHTKLLLGAMLESSFAYYKPYIEQHQNPLDTLNTTTFQAMQSWGMNAVRINMSQWIQQADTSNQYLTRLDTAIASANQAGLYVVVDFHDDGQSGAAAPYTDGMLHKTSETWWISLANRYKANNMVLFDLINEPKYPNWQEWEHGDGNDVVGLLDVTKAIRAAGANNIIVLEPGAAAGSQLKGWQGLTATDITDKNSIVSKHDYGNIPNGYFSSDPTTYWSQDWGPFIGVRPLYYGEWAVLPHPNYPSFCKGVTSSNADAVTNAFMTYMRSIGASWTAWSFTPTHMIDGWTTLQPTSMQTGAPWSCPVTTGPAMNAGMGTDVKTFLAANTGSGGGSGSNLKLVIAKGDSIIATRLQGLSQLLQKLAADTKLSQTDKASLQTEVNNETSGLTKLKTKLDAETSLSAAQADVTSLTTEFKVFGFLVPKVDILSTADWQQVVEDNLSVLAGKLRSRIGTDQQLLALLSDMNKHISSAQADSSSVEKNVLPLKDTDYAQNHNLFLGYISQLQQAHTDSSTADTDAQTIINALIACGSSSATVPLSPLHVQGGAIENTHNCAVYLKGVNTAGTEFNDATGDGLTSSYIASVASTIHSNIWRVSLNSYWWNHNVYVPKEKMNYQSWVKQLVSWIEQSGSYAELDATTYFTFPPCGPGVAYCPPQDANAQNGINLSEQARVNDAAAMFTQLAQLYKNDPAVLYDALNEPTIQNFPNFTADMNTVINAIRAQSPASVVMVYTIGLDQTMAGTAADYKQSNLVYDFHIYPSTNWQTRLTDFQQKISWVQQRDHGVVLGEWGGANDPPAYSQEVTQTIAQKDGVTLTYYDVQNLLDPKTGQVSANGKLVSSEYAALHQ